MKRSHDFISWAQEISPDYEYVSCILKVTLTHMKRSHDFNFLAQEISLDYEYVTTLIVLNPNTCLLINS